MKFFCRNLIFLFLISCSELGVEETHPFPIPILDEVNKSSNGEEALDMCFVESKFSKGKVDFSETFSEGTFCTWTNDSFSWFFAPTTDCQTEFKSSSNFDKHTHITAMTISELPHECGTGGRRYMNRGMTSEDLSRGSGPICFLKSDEIPYTFTDIMFVYQRIPYEGWLVFKDNSAMLTFHENAPHPNGGNWHLTVRELFKQNKIAWNPVPCSDLLLESTAR